jgi:hypothetical protein
MYNLLTPERLVEWMSVGGAKRVRQRGKNNLSDDSNRVDVKG